ncbi:hypothetical protein ACEWY4_016395 [Coilia grayii]|uniref:Glucagon / GIP / secretin / VIP family domain-containing protein n=1 Tax=Coilia grayii TaxID=363190 RepID=A0ABD1JKF3_9TELE
MKQPEKDNLRTTTSPPAPLTQAVCSLLYSYTGIIMTSMQSLAGFLLLIIVQSSWQIPLMEEQGSPSLEPQDGPLEEPKDVHSMKRHSEGTFSNDYSKYLENRRAQDFVQWLMNSKRSGGPTRRHADGTFTSDVSTYLQDQAAKDFVTWLKSGQTRRELEEPLGTESLQRRHVDGSFTTDMNKVLDSLAAKEYLMWVMNSKPAATRLQYITTARLPL